MKKLVYLLLACMFTFLACQGELDDKGFTRNRKANFANTELAKQWATEFLGDINSSTRSHRNTVVSSVFPLCTNKIYSKLMTRNLDYEALPDTILYVVNLGKG